MILPNERAGRSRLPSSRLQSVSMTHLPIRHEPKTHTGVNTDVEAGADDAALVQSAIELDDDLARSVVVDDLELADVACLRQCVFTED